jgi:hypothetical protein
VRVMQDACRHTPQKRRRHSALTARPDDDRGGVDFIRLCQQRGPCLRLAPKRVRLGVETGIARQVGALGRDALGVAEVLLVELGGRVSHRAGQPIDVGMEQEGGERIPDVRDDRRTWPEHGTGAADCGRGVVRAVISDQNDSGFRAHAARA